MFPIHPQAAILSMRYLSTLAWILKAQVRGEDEAIQKQILKLMLTCSKNDDNSEYQWIREQPKKCVAMASRIRQICSLANNASSASNWSNQFYFVETHIMELEASVGVCERLFGSPIPPTYTRHLSRVMSLWLFLLPVSLVMTGGLNTLTAASVVAIATYVFVGLDEVGTETLYSKMLQYRNLFVRNFASIPSHALFFWGGSVGPTGMEIENVFQLLPLQQLAAAAQKDAQGMLC